MKVRFLTLAQREVDDAVSWYEQQAVGLGLEFLDELDRVVRLVRSYPQIATPNRAEHSPISIHAFSLLLKLWPGWRHNRCNRCCSPASRATVLGRQNQLVVNSVISEKAFLLHRLFSNMSQARRLALSDC